MTEGATAARHARSGSEASARASRSRKSETSFSSSKTSPPRDEKAGSPQLGVLLTLASTSANVGSGGATISPDAILRASGSRKRASPNSYAAIRARASRRAETSPKDGSAFLASAARNARAVSVSRGGAFSNDTLGKFCLTRDPAATIHFSADRSRGTSSGVCTKSRRDPTRISAGRERGAKEGADAADGRVADVAPATSYAPGPGVEPSGDETSSSGRSLARFPRVSLRSSFRSTETFDRSSSESRRLVGAFLFRRRARSASRRETPFFLFALAASGRNTTQGARRRRKASEGIV